MQSIILAALLPLLGVFVGGLLQYLSSRKLEGRKQLILEKGKAYSDYFRSFSQAATVGSSKEVLSAAIDAKTRICLYSSIEVIERLADFERSGAIALQNEAKVTALLRAMRRDMGGSRSVPLEEDLGFIIFGRKIL